MNAFKFVLVLCSAVAVSCSGQYMQPGRPSWDNQPTTTEGSVGGQMYYANQAATAAPNAGPQQAETAAPAQQSYSAAAHPPAPTNTNVPHSAFPAVTNQICTCMAVSESTAADMLEQAQQQSAPAQQTYASSQSYVNPAAQTLPAPASAQTGSYSQSAPSQPETARPAYATPVSASGY